MKTTCLPFIILLAAMPAIGLFAQIPHEYAASIAAGLPKPEDPVLLPSDAEVARLTNEQRASWLKYLEHDPDGWDDLWVLVQLSHDKNYEFNPKDKTKDTDGDGFTDYEEMLCHRSATYKEPVLSKEQQIAQIREARRQAIVAFEKATAFWNSEQVRLTPYRRRVIKDAAEEPQSGELKEFYDSVSAGYGGRMQQLQNQQAQNEALLDQQSRLAGVPRVRVSPDGGKELFAGLVGEVPAFNSSLGVIGAASISTDELWPAGHGPYTTSENAGLSLTGSGVTLGVWEADGAVRTTHGEFGGRVTQREGASAPPPNAHATAVSGVMVGVGLPLPFAGNVPLAAGAAYQANISARTLVNFNTALPGDVGTAAAPLLLISNHSWGRRGGWSFGAVATGPGVTLQNQWIWGGLQGANTAQDFKYGFYYPNLGDGSGSTQIDQFLANDGLRHLMVYAAGNDRGTGPGSATTYYYPPIPPQIYHTARTNPPANERDWTNGDDDTNGYDTVLAPGTCKNVLTVGACRDVHYPDPANAPNGRLLGFGPGGTFSMAPFSGCGPTDDGRIKPDVVAVGQADPALRNFGLVLPSETSDSAYGTTWSGTSMATPSVTGAVGLLLHRRAQLFPALNPLTDGWLGASLKAIVIQTADDVLTAGPDYTTGYGLVNALKMVRLAEADKQDGRGSHVKELTLNNGASQTWEVQSSGAAPLRWTLAWADKPGVPGTTAVADPVTAMLVNNLDLKVERLIGATVAQTFRPWILNPDLTNTNTTTQATNRAAAATTGIDNRNNVEQVYIGTPVAGRYRITVTHSGGLAGGPAPSTQAYSIVSSGETPLAPTITSLLRSPAGNQVTLNFTADPGAYFSVQTSTNLQTWQNDGSVYAASATNTVTRSASAEESKRYWRLKRGQP